MKRQPESAVGARLSERSFSDLAGFLHESCGIRLAPQKRLMVESRLMRRVRATGAKNFDSYCQALFRAREATELSVVIDLLTTHKTDFFREKHHFDFLSKNIAEPFRAIWPSCERQLRVWSAGCSTGEEAYSAAMVLDDVLAPCSFRVVATDVSEGTLRQAAAGRYDEADVAPIPPDLRRKYVHERAGAFEVAPDLRERVSFQKHNLMDDRYPDRPRHHVIFCRNTLVYFDRETQKNVLTKMARTLVPRGFLFLGHSESMNGMSLPFDTLGPTTFRKRGDV